MAGQSLFAILKQLLHEGTSDVVFNHEFLAATQALSLCAVTAERFTAYDNFLTRTPPTDPLAQRENKWICRFQVRPP